MAPRPWTRADYTAHFATFLAETAATMAPLSRTRFGYFAVGEPSFMRYMEEGKRKIRLETIERAMLFVKEYRKKHKVAIS